MNSNEIDKAFNMFRNGICQGSSDYIQYNSLIPECGGSATIFRCQKDALGTLIVFIDDGQPHLYSYSELIDDTVKLSTNFPSIQLTIKNTGDSTCKILVEQENQPPVVIGTKHLDTKRRIDSFYLLAANYDFTHLCIYNSKFGSKVLNLYTEDSSVSDYYNMLFAYCTKSHALADPAKKQEERTTSNGRY